jgi:hypothetical protein
MTIAFYEHPFSSYVQKAKTVLYEKAISFESKMIDGSEGRNEHLFDAHLLVKRSFIAPGFGELSACPQPAPISSRLLPIAAEHRGAPPTHRGLRPVVEHPLALI